MLQIMIMLEDIRPYQLKWLPISHHHDGCALLLVELARREENEITRLCARSLSFSEISAKKYGSYSFVGRARIFYHNSLTLSLEVLTTV